MTWPSTNKSWFPKYADTAMLEKETKAAYMKAAKAKMTASIMLPAERAGWK
jgi:hypothetical protein